MQNRGKLLFLMVVLAFTSPALFATIDLYEFSSEVNQARYKALTKELRCPKCQNQDIADSNAPIAQDMRREVHRLLEAGQDDRSIVRFMVDRFGEFVSYKPKIKPATYLLWYGPWVLLVLGGMIILLMAGRRILKQGKNSVEGEAMQKQKVCDQGSEQNLTDQHQKVEQLLSRFKDE